MSEMKILGIKRSKERTGLKVYAVVHGECTKDYRVGYFRRENFRGWLCTCESFMLTEFPRKRNCKHIRFVKKNAGRFAERVK
jgi:hypothetical protein